MCFILFVGLSCSSDQSKEQTVLARVNKNILTKQGLGQLVAGKINKPKAVTAATHKWVKKNLLYSAAISAGLDRDEKLIKQRDVFYRELLGAAFLDVQKTNKIKVTKKDVSDYYSKNRGSFFRKSDAVLIKHFVLPSKKEAEKIKKALKNRREGEALEEYIKKYKPETKTIQKNLVKDNLAGFIFSGKRGAVLGPKKRGVFFHVFEIIQTYKKGDVLGLELVYDEVYQRIYKQKEIQLVNGVVDSLYSSSSVFISPEVQ